MKRHLLVIWMLTLLIARQGIAQEAADFPLQIDSVEEAEDLNALFAPQDEGWLGGDVAHSILLSEDRILWLFGDTLLGRMENGARNLRAFINNSIAIQQPESADGEAIDFHWGAGDSAFFPHQTGTPGNFYWPTNGLLVQNRLFLFCYAVSTGGPFGFTIDGTVVITVDNYDDPAGQWNQNAYDFGIGGGDIDIHAGLFAEGETVYFMGRFRQGGTFSAILARMDEADLLADGTAADLEFLVDEGGARVWRSEPVGLVELFTPGVSETNIQFLPQFDRYLTTTYEVFGPAIYLTSAETLSGPWAPLARLYNVPEHQEVSFSIISYAARLHPELSQSPRELVVSYATNSFGTLDPLMTAEGAGIYVPRFIRVRLKPLPIWTDHFMLY